MRLGVDNLAGIAQFVGPCATLRGPWFGRVAAAVLELQGTPRCG